MRSYPLACRLFSCHLALLVALLDGSRDAGTSSNARHSGIKVHRASRTSFLVRVEMHLGEQSFKSIIGVQERKDRIGLDRNQKRTVFSIGFF